MLPGILMEVRRAELRARCTSALLCLHLLRSPLPLLAPLLAAHGHSGGKDDCHSVFNLISPPKFSWFPHQMQLCSAKMLYCLMFTCADHRCSKQDLPGSVICWKRERRKEQNVVMLWAWRRGYSNGLGWRCHKLEGKPVGIWTPLGIWEWASVRFISDECHRLGQAFCL